MQTPPVPKTVSQTKSMARQRQTLAMDTCIYGTCTPASWPVQSRIISAVQCKQVILCRFSITTS